MRLWGDERGQSVQIGAVLLFGFLVVSMATYQASVVPQQNERVEFRHSQAVQGDLQRLHDAALRTSTTGMTQSTSVAVGTTYQPRTMFVNPPAPSGTMRTTDGGTMGYGVVNAEASGPVDEFWAAGEDGLFVTSGALVYSPGYHEYRDPPETVVEGSLTYNRFDDATVPLTDQSLVNGRTISLVTFEGALSRSRSGVTSVDTRPLSVSTNTVTVRSEDDEGIAIGVLTGAPESTWRDALANEVEAGNVERIDYHSNGWLRENEDELVDYVDGPLSFDRGQGLVVVRLNATRTYDLRMAKVGVGTGGTTPEPAYLVHVDDRRPAGDDSGRVTVEVRDAFNNPVPGATVEAVDDGGVVVEESLTTGADGRATFTYEDPAAPTETVRLRIDDGAAGYEYVDVTLRGEDPRETFGYDVRWDTAAIESETGVTCADADVDGTVDTCALDPDASSTLEMTVATTPPTAQVFVDLASGDAGVASFSNSEGNTDGEGKLVRKLNKYDTGTTTVYASSSARSDELAVEVIDGGAYYRYYEGDYGGSDGYMPDFDAETPTATGFAPGFDLSPRERDTDFGFAYTATLSVPTSGNYTFYTASDDGSELYVDGDRVVANGGDHGTAEANGTVALSAGEHTVRVVYYQGRGSKDLTVSWKGPGFTKEPITTDALRPRKPDDGA